MRYAELAWRIGRGAALAVALLGGLAACGGGNSSETTITGGGLSGGQAGPEVVIDQPQGDNTTEVVVDSGPGGGFALGVANLPYVTVKVCAPGSSTQCAVIDHVFLDTGSIGLRLLRSTVAGLGLPAMTAAGRTVTECYPFVVGAVWGPLARADLQVGGERASNLPVQLIDDASPPLAAPTSDCLNAANGSLLTSMSLLQAKGVLGVGMLRYDCGLVCDQGNYGNSYTLYYGCDAGGSCTATPVPADEQVQNPVTYFAVDNNGTIVVLPAVPDTGASVARGRLVFGIGTQSNNQLDTGTSVLQVETDPASPSYLYLSTALAGQRYDFSYIDSGSNGLFFDDAGLSTQCVASGGGSAWYCPPTLQTRTATLQDALGGQATVTLSIANADLLFGTSNAAFSNLAGAAGSANPAAFVWGLPFFFGKQVYTAIWGQVLAQNGPWFAFK
jgi:hypothetical protein